MNAFSAPLAIGITCVIVVVLAGFAWYDAVIKPAIDRDLSQIGAPSPAEKAAHEANYGESTGIRLPDAAWDGVERRRTVYVRPGKYTRFPDVYDGADL